MGSTERYSSEYGPEKICRARVINKDEKKETIYGHPNATVSDILGRTYHVIRKFVTFSNDWVFLSYSYILSSLSLISLDLSNQSSI